MSKVIILLMVGILISCSHPYYTRERILKFRSDQTPVKMDDIKILSFHFSAGQRKGSLRVITDTLKVNFDVKASLLESLKKQGFSQKELMYDDDLEILIDPKLRWRNRRLKNFLQEQKFESNTLVPIICYNVSFAPEKSGGGGLEFVYKTGNDRYMIGHEVYIAFYNDDGLAYLRNISRWDEKIVPAGTPITHEFPQEVLDTLMQIALEPLIRQMEKER